MLIIDRKFFSCLELEKVLFQDVTQRGKKRLQFSERKNQLFDERDFNVANANIATVIFVSLDMNCITFRKSQVLI